MGSGVDRADGLQRRVHGRACVASPTLGWLADAGGLSPVFLVSAVVVAGTAALGVLVLHSQLAGESQLRPSPTPVRG